MKGKKTTMTIRVDEDVKKNAQVLYKSLGVDMSTAINVFLRMSIAAGGFPFDVRIPNAETLESLKEADDMIAHPEKYKSFSSVEELMEDLLSDDDN